MSTTERSKKEQLNKDKCQRCMMYLKSALFDENSKTHIIFRAMGVDMALSSLSSRTITPTDNHNTTSISKMEDNGVGIEIQIPKSNRTIAYDNKSAFGGSFPLRKTVLQSSDGVVSNKLGNNNHNDTNPDSGKRENPRINHISEQKLSPISTISKQSTATPTPTPTATADVNQHEIPYHNFPVTSTPKEGQSNHLDYNYKDKNILLSIMCKVCGTEGPEGAARAYVRGPTPLSIVLCSNRLPTQDDVSEVLTHELIHIYDVHKRNWDLTDCNTLAKSEIRAAREAECADVSFNFTKRFCVKNKAKAATKNMFPGKTGEGCIRSVFEEAMRDKVPLENYNNKRDNQNSSVEVASHSHSSSLDNSINGRVFKSSYAPNFYPTSSRSPPRYFKERNSSD